MNSFEIYSTHLAEYYKNFDTKTNGPVSILVKGRVDEGLLVDIKNLLVQDILFLSQNTDVSPNITIDFNGFSDDFWKVSAVGLYIPFIQNTDQKVDYIQYIGKDKIVDFVNCTSFIHQYKDFWVIEKRPSPGVISGSYL